MSRFNIADRIKEEEQREAEQERLRKKHSIDEENVVIIEKTNAYKFTIKTLIALIKTTASILLICLAVIGLFTIIYPNIREEFLLIFMDTLHQLEMIIGA